MRLIKINYNENSAKRSFMKACGQCIANGLAVAVRWRFYHKSYYEELKFQFALHCHMSHCHATDSKRLLCFSAVFIQ